MGKEEEEDKDKGTRRSGDKKKQKKTTKKKRYMYLLLEAREGGLHLPHQSPPCPVSCCFAVAEPMPRANH